MLVCQWMWRLRWHPASSSQASTFASDTSRTQQNQSRNRPSLNGARDFLERSQHAQDPPSRKLSWVSLLLEQASNAPSCDERCNKFSVTHRQSHTKHKHTKDLTRTCRGIASATIENHKPSKDHNSSTKYKVLSLQTWLFLVSRDSWWVCLPYKQCDKSSLAACP